jgi:hypothetical protein
MVASVLYCFVLLAAQQPANSVLERLDPPRRAAVVMALLALVLTGLLLVTCAMLGGHWVRRMARHRPAGRDRSSGEAIKNRQLRESLQVVLPNSKSSDTVQLDTSTKETRIEP